MAGIASFAEILAAKAGKSVPEVEESLAQKAEQAEQAKNLQQSRDYEYDNAVQQAASTPSTPPSIEDIVAKASVQSDPESVSLGQNALNPQASDVPPATVDQFNAGKKTDAYSLGNNKGVVAGAGAAGLGATALMYGGGQPNSPSSTPPVQGPTPASATPDAKPIETPEETQEKSTYKKILSMLSPSERKVTDLSALPGTSLGSDTELKKAMAQRDQNRLINDFEKGAQLFGSGLSGTDYMKTGGAQLEEQGKLADQPVKDLEKRIENQENDPKSTASVAMRGIALKMGFKFGDNVSAADIKKQIPQITSLQTHADSLEALKANKAMAMLAHQDALKQKHLDNENKTLMDTQRILESARGNPAAAQAEKDIYSANKADSLATMYGDPNKLSMPQVRLLASEIAKIASGGVPSDHELDGITPKSLKGKMSEAVTQLTNNPTPASAAAFVRQYQDYTKELKRDAQNVIKDKYGRVIESRKAQLGADNYNSLKQNYINRFDIHPETNAFSPDVLNYASKHGITPEQAQAVKIQRTGGK